MNQDLSAFQSCGIRVEDSPTSTLSSTLVIHDPNAHWLGVQKDLMRELSNFGELARLDASMAPILRMVSITFFDVRAASAACAYLAGRAEQLPPTGDDFRIVLVSMAAFEEKLGVSCDFSQFGEVASVSAFGGSTIVEYFDMRGAMMLVAAAGGSASPCTPQRLAQHTQAKAATAAAAAAAAAEALRSPAASATLAPPPGLEVDAGPMSHRRSSEPVLPSVSAEPWVVSPHSRRNSADQSSPMAMKKQNSDAVSPNSPGGSEATPKGVNRPVRTKVSSRDFSKYDVDPDKIARGEDNRTTVMVRNLVGPRARKDFLKLLEKCGLADRYTFFYMPCKEHRDVPAGFAFVNLNTPADVLKLHSVVKRDVWRTTIRDAQVKALGLSYARFQGHEELMAHFSSSVVLCEQDPDKRPLFCNANATKTNGKEAGQGDEKKSSDGEDPQANATWVGA